MNRTEFETSKQYFAAYPTEDVLHVTSDGQVFLNSGKSDAINHQASLKMRDANASMTSLYRKDFEATTEEDLAKDELAEGEADATLETEPVKPAATKKGKGAKGKDAEPAAGSIPEGDADLDETAKKE